MDGEESHSFSEMIALAAFCLHPLFYFFFDVRVVLLNFFLLVALYCLVFIVYLVLSMLRTRQFYIGTELVAAADHKKQFILRIIGWLLVIAVLLVFEYTVITDGKGDIVFIKLWRYLSA
ncbi:MAG: hypothetical protein LBR29_02045 [Methylobacteriaceae bacterium]|nr:hypothetical protein [Methylobacteriaceae bacterium]